MSNAGRYCQAKQIAMWNQNPNIFEFSPFCLIICVSSAPEIHESKQQNMPLHCLNIVTPSGPSTIHVFIYASFKVFFVQLASSRV